MFGYLVWKGSNELSEDMKNIFILYAYLREAVKFGKTEKMMHLKWTVKADTEHRMGNGGFGLKSLQGL